MLSNDSTISSDSSTHDKRRVTVSGGSVMLDGVMSLPASARALVLFAFDRANDAEQMLNGMNILVEASRKAGLATLQVNLLTPEDEELDKMTGFFRENVSILHQRVLGITNWLIVNADMQNMSIGYLGVGVSAAAILAAAAIRPDAVSAIVAVTPRIDLVSSYLPTVVTPTLLIVAEKDTQALDRSRKALPELTSNTTLDIVKQARKRGASNALETISNVDNVFETEQSLQQVEQLSTGWFTRYLS